MADDTLDLPCELCLAIPAHAGGAVEPSALSLLLAGGDIACIILYGQPIKRGEHAPLDETIALALLGIAQENGVAALIAHDIAAAKRLGADGVHILANEQGYSEARSVLGREANIGVACGVSRHDAMVMAEAGADYVSFGADLGLHALGPEHEVAAEMTQWWAEVFEPPCMAWCTSRDDARDLHDAGADFLGIGPWLWHEPERAGDALAQMMGGLID